jgi:hypothetical protein
MLTPIERCVVRESTLASRLEDQRRPRQRRHPTAVDLRGHVRADQLTNAPSPPAPIGERRRPLPSHPNPSCASPARVQQEVPRHCRRAARRLPDSRRALLIA